MKYLSQEGCYAYLNVWETPSDIFSSAAALGCGLNAHLIV